MTKKLSALLCCGLLYCSTASHAQQAGPSTRTLSFQGVVTAKGKAVDGDRKLIVRFYSDAQGMHEVWNDAYHTHLTDGVFSIDLGSGNALPPAEVLSKQLWIGLQVDGDAEMRPLSPLAASPFALSIADRSVTKEKMATDYISSVTINGQRLTGHGAEINFVTGDGIAATIDPASNAVMLARTSKETTKGATAQASNNFIANGTSQQSADFNVSGTGTIGGALTVGGTIHTALGAGMVHSSSGGVLSSSAVALGSDVSGTLPIANGGTGATSASAALSNLLPSQSGNEGKYLMIGSNGDVTWSSAQGIQGPEGPQGPAGATGATGPQGPAGHDGAAGPQGPVGADGQDGAVGPQGPAGHDGATGPQGPAGADGHDGTTGPQGPAGHDGATGPQGPAGADGHDGATGPQGPAGADGHDGAMGPQGPAGHDGATGPQGPAGADGHDGATGPQGPAGADGHDGATGPQGPAGVVTANSPLAYDGQTQTVSLSGVVAVANGGTGTGTAPTSGGVIYGSAAGYASTGAGTAGQVLTSNGSGAPTWQSVSSASGGMQYDVTSAQNSATTGADNLFNVAYNTTDATAAGAVINSSTSGTTSATGLSADAAARGGMVIGIKSGSSGGGSNFGVAGAGNATTSQLTTFMSSNLPSGVNVGVLGYSTGGPASGNGAGVGLVAWNDGTSNNDLAAYMHCNGSTTLRVESKPSSDVSAGTNMSATRSSVEATDGAAAVQNNRPTMLSSSDNQTVTTGNFVVAQGSTNEARTSGSGLGSAMGMAQATGVVGLATYTNSNADAASTDFMIGVRGSTQTWSSRKINALSIVGQSNGGSYIRSVGGYFQPSNGSDANLGVVAQIGGGNNNAWQESTLLHMNAALVGIDYNNAGSTERALYTSGAVQMKNTTGTGASLMTIDANGNVGSLASTGTAGQVLTSNGTSAPTWQAANNGTQAFSTVGGNYSIASGDCVIMSSGTSTTVTFPSSATAGRMITVIDASGTTSINPNGNRFVYNGGVSGSTITVSSLSKRSVTFVGDGTNWEMIGSN